MAKARLGETIQLTTCGADMDRESRLAKAVKWVLEDAAFKAPEEFNWLTRRYIDCLEAAWNGDEKGVSKIVSTTLKGTPSTSLARFEPKGREPSLTEILAEVILARQDMAALRSDLAVTFSLDEFDEKRREMSNRLTEIVIRRL